MIEKIVHIGMRNEKNMKIKGRKGEAGHVF